MHGESSSLVAKRVEDESKAAIEQPALLSGVPCWLSVADPGGDNV